MVGHRHVDYRICIQAVSAKAIDISDCHVTPTADTVRYWFGLRNWSVDQNSNLAYSCVSAYLHCW